MVESIAKTAQAIAGRQRRETNFDRLCAKCPQLGELPPAALQRAKLSRLARSLALGSETKAATPAKVLSVSA
jgi:hypothetical protein